MSLICAITGQILEDPVISTKSGHVFEKRVIENHLKNNDQCPITNQNLLQSDLIALQVSKSLRPRDVKDTGLPNLLDSFQNQWDSLVQETHTLKQHLSAVREELSHALYQHDAACRVIARLIKERDEARSQLSSQDQSQLQIQQNEMDVEQQAEKTNTQIPSEIIEDITENAFKLNNQRKERKQLKDQMFSNYCGSEAISNFQFKSQVELHSDKKVGILCMDIHPMADQFIATGGVDGSMLVYDTTSKETLFNINLHKKQINDISFIPGQDSISIVGCSDDKQLTVHSYDLDKKTKKTEYTSKLHKGEVTGCAVHPLGYLVAACSNDQTFSFHDVLAGKKIAHFNGFDKSSQFQSLKFHPDGHILALGSSDGKVKLWNSTDEQVIATLDAHNEAADKISFSENGYMFASGSTKDGIVKIWDLRNQMRVVHTFLEDSQENLGSLCFDPSGRYLSIGLNSKMQIFQLKNFEKFVEFKAHSNLVTAIKFGNYSKFFASASIDRSLIVHSL